MDTVATLQEPAAFELASAVPAPSRRPARASRRAGTRLPAALPLPFAGIVLLVGAAAFLVFGALSALTALG